MKTSEDLKKISAQMAESVKTQRDELQVKMHLASLEIQTEWSEVENKWNHFSLKSKQLEKEAGHSAHEVGEAFAILGNELKESYRRLRQSLS
ncbi:MAG: methionine synthase II (cobalamin-independent) [Cryomorphaceae bacterium]|jgi:methionine synthase II (cobalamin-independent)